jgi:hypothetical protein
MVGTSITRLFYRSVHIRLPSRQRWLMTDEKKLGRDASAAGGFEIELVCALVLID